jgi:hypothetical protein
MAMAEIDENLIIHFLCTHRMDSTKVDMDPYLMEKDFIFFPIVNRKYPEQISGLSVTQYLKRIKILFTSYRGQN